MRSPEPEPIPFTLTFTGFVDPDALDILPPAGNISHMNAANVATSLGLIATSPSLRLEIGETQEQAIPYDDRYVTLEQDPRLPGEQIPTLTCDNAVLVGERQGMSPSMVKRVVNFVLRSSLERNAATGRFRPTGQLLEDYAVLKRFETDDWRVVGLRADKLEELIERLKAEDVGIKNFGGKSLAILEVLAAEIKLPLAPES